ncbi:MAG: hypothetical protein ACYTET_05640 [Planctomycetota bacterium]|jgi:hypothetical protein
MRTTIKLIIGLMLCVMLAAGCLQRDALVKEQYLIQAETPKAQGELVDEAIVTVIPFSISPMFQSNGFVYRVGPSKYTTDFYNEYVIAPSQMMSGQTHNWLIASGFKVVPATSHAEPEYLVEGNIRQLYADLRDKADPQAVLEIFFTVIKPERKENELVFAKTYAETVKMKEVTPGYYVEAMEECLSEVLGDLTKDLKATRIEILNP